MRVLRAMLFVVAALAVSVAAAQDTVEIVIGGQIVARIRDKGPYDSLAARAAKVDQRIDDVISYEDTQNPKVKVKEVDGIWHVFCGDRPILGVYPADAKAQSIDAKGLAAIWMRQIKLALPKATPVSKLPPTAAAATGGVTPAPRVPRAPENEQPAGVRAATPGDTGEPATAHVTPAPTTSTRPTGDTVPGAAPAGEPTEPSKTPRTAALLLLFDSFRVVRALTEEEYLAGRDGLASNLLANLEPFMAEVRESGLAAGTPQPPRPIVVESPTPPAPDETGTVTAEAPPTIPTVPTVPTVPTIPTASEDTGASAPEAPPGVDPSRAKVPQKERIGRKFKAAEKPYADLRASGGPALEQVTQLLKEARRAFFTAADFDTAEAKVDEALTVMGVPIPD